MNCNLCGEMYSGLAQDCACTMYGYTYEEDIPAELLEAYRRGQAEKKRRDLRYQAWKTKQVIRIKIVPLVWLVGILGVGILIGALVT